MSSLPILLMNPSVVLIGGGKVALRKARVLLDNQIQLKVVAQKYLQEFYSLNLELSCKLFDSEDLRGFDIVVDATGDVAVAEAILVEKGKRHLLVNIAADSKRSDFFFPAMINYGKLKIAVSTDGASPTAGRVVRDQIKAVVPESVNDLLYEQARDRADGIISPDDIRKQILKLLEEADVSRERDS